VGSYLSSPVTLALASPVDWISRPWNFIAARFSGEKVTMRYFGLMVLGTIVLATSIVQPAVAVVQFYNVYAKEYLDTHPDKEYAAAVKKAAVRCLVCHQGKNRKHHNAFGEHLDELLDRKTDLRDVDKVSAALKKVLDMHVDPKDEKSETYLERIKAGKWPGGELEDLKKEPPEGESQQAGG
jgi:cytochrome c2